MRALEAFDRLPFLVRGLIVFGIVIPAGRGILAASRAYMAWLPSGPLGLALFAVTATVALLVLLTIAGGVSSANRARAGGNGHAALDEADDDTARRRQLQRLADDMRQVATDADRRQGPVRGSA